jgi:hypothetical protein
MNEGGTLLMIRRITTLVVAALMMMALAVPAFAANAPEGCTKDRGTINCPSDAKNDRFDDNQVTTKKGSVSSSHEEETQCVQRPCPPGQYN